MSPHKSEDYKKSAVKYYIKNDTSYAETCRIFECSERSLKRWIDRYTKEKNIKRHNKKPTSYKITKEQVKYAIKLLRDNQQITMAELVKLMGKKYKNFDITPQHLGGVLRDNNKTRKRTRITHFPKTRYNVEINKEEELKKFYKVTDKQRIDKIISIDETSIQPSMELSYSRCQLGRRCAKKTDNNFVFRKFTLLVAITNKGLIGAKLYEKGGMTKERFAEFIEEFIEDKYKNHLIILDNAGSHNNQFVKDKIVQTKNNSN